LKLFYGIVQLYLKEGVYGNANTVALS